MRTDNELQQMSHDELIEQVKGLQFQLAGMELAEKENARMREILSAIGIIYVFKIIFSVNSHGKYER